MPVTLTIKQVPDALAGKLRERAAASHRSLQGELMAILHEAIDAPPHAGEPERNAYKVNRAPAVKRVPTHGARLTLTELWERAQRLGPKSKSESAAIVRRLRDERYRR